MRHAARTGGTPREVGRGPVGDSEHDGVFMLSCIGHRLLRKCSERCSPCNEPMRYAPALNLLSCSEPRTRAGCRAQRHALMLALQRAADYAPLPCNAFAWCSEEVCFEPDAHKHSLGDCWLKFTEGPASPEVLLKHA